MMEGLWVDEVCTYEDGTEFDSEMITSRYLVRFSDGCEQWNDRVVVKGRVIDAFETMLLNGETPKEHMVLLTPKEYL